MYYCNDCKREFKEPKIKSVNAEDYYGISEQFLSTNYINEALCPYCDSDDYEKMEKCSMCDEYFRHDDLINTEGLANGDRGYVCEDCLKDLS